MIAQTEDLRRWFAACLALCFVPGMLAMTLVGTARIGFAVTVAVAGFVSTPILNALSDSFWFTWPAGLFGVLAAAVLASRQFQREPTPAGKRAARLWGLALIATSVGYFLVLRDASLPHEWCFLLGVVPAAPLMIAASAVRSLGAFLILSVTAFTVFFWAGPLWQRVI